MYLVARLTAKKGCEEELRTVLKNMVSKVNQETGCLLYTLHQSAENPGVFLFYEQYADSDALVHHRETPHYQELKGKLLPPLLAKEPEIELYEEVACISR